MQHQQVIAGSETGPCVAGSGSSSDWALTQGMWRMLNNDSVTLTALAEPLIDAGRRASLETDSPMLLVHDWSKLRFGSHASKRDTHTLTHRHDIGYELTSALLLRGDTGAPVAPMQIHLRTSASRMLSTAEHAPDRDMPHIEQVMPTMQVADTWNLAQPLVHVIDREADSVGHYRQWNKQGHLFLVRADDRKVLWKKQETRLKAIAENLLKTPGVHETIAEYRGRKVTRLAAETQVVLHRPAKPKRISPRAAEATELPLRLIVTQVTDGTKNPPSTWLLLTNVPPTQADTDQIAQWYAWRWRIESFFKLLKSEGHQIERWQQHTGEAIARRLLIAATACQLALQLAQDQSPESAEVKKLLTRLSGRLTRRGQPPSAATLLAGLRALLPVLDLLNQDEYDLKTLNQLAAIALPRGRLEVV